MKTKSKPRGDGAPKRAKRSARSSSPSPKSKALAKPAELSLPEKVEQVIIGGDLAVLSAEERVSYVKTVCRSMGINWLTNPFAYIQLNNRLVLYALKGCTDQLRKVHGISLTGPPVIEFEHGLCTVTVGVCDRTGRIDGDVGCVKTEGLSGDALANSIMKATTKSKRRATLSICGLGMLDESELDTMTGYGTLTPGGRVMTVNAEPDVPRRIGSKAAAQAVADRKIAEHAAKQASPAPDPNKVLFWARRSEDAFYLWAYTAEVQPLLNSKEVMAAQADGRWIVEKGGMTLVKEWCARNGHVLQ